FGSAMSSSWPAYRPSCRPCSTRSPPSSKPAFACCRRPCARTRARATSAPSSARSPRPIPKSRLAAIRSSIRSMGPIPMWCCARPTRKSSRWPGARWRRCSGGCGARNRAGGDRRGPARLGQTRTRSADRATDLRADVLAMPACLRPRVRLQRGGPACEEAVMPFHPTRRRMLGALAAAGFAFDDALAAPLAATPACHDGDEPTVRQTEGPYFKPSSPLRADLVEPNSSARPVEVSGQVLTRACQPVVRALLDFWHADERGEYDNVGFRYRGHLFTDADGRYRLHTILPALSIPDAPATITSSCRRRTPAPRTSGRRRRGGACSPPTSTSRTIG